jgi:acetoin utilization protein AcuB
MARAIIAEVMTPEPLTIEPEAPLVRAHLVMREAHVHHLVVMAASQLCGVISLDDLHLMESLRDVDPRQVPVEDAMSATVYTVMPGDSVAEVSAGMLARNADVAVVADGERVVGIFTVRDALALLVRLATVGDPHTSAPIVG